MYLTGWKAILRRSLSVGLIAVLIFSVRLQRGGTQAAPASSGPVPATQSVLADELTSVPLIPQDANLWCWAACTEMVVRTLNPSISDRAKQCEQARMAFGVQSSCTQPTPESAINGGWPQFEHFGIHAKATDDEALKWEEICHQITDKKVPIIFSWHWISSNNRRNGGHALILIGYATGADGNRVTIFDPLTNEKKSITYETYVGHGLAGNGPSDYSGYQAHTHWNDYYDITLNKP